MSILFEQRRKKRGGERETRERCLEETQEIGLLVYLMVSECFAHLLDEVASLVWWDGRKERKDCEKRRCSNEKNVEIAVEW